MGSHLARVKPIIDAVREQGDAALVRFAKEFDGVSLDEKSLCASREEYAEAEKALDPKLQETMEFAANNIHAYQTRLLPEKREWSFEINPGVVVGERVLPIESVACYCPRGKGSFPSVALMSLLPAVVAGVPKIVLLTPPGPDGKVDAATLYAAKLAGVSLVVKAGGAQAVAAAAFGTASVPKCVKLEGPGSPWFMAARQLLADKIHSRLPAGPSESLLLADESADPHLCAVDLLIEAEHGADSSSFVVTWDAKLAGAVARELPALIAELNNERRGYVEAVLGGDSGGIVLAANKSVAYRFINDYAPEHLQIMSTEPRRHLPHITNAAEILLGHLTAGSLGNYMMGPNHVLPTNGAARVHSPLSVRDFQKICTVGQVDRQGYGLLAPHTKRFASYEGFDAHARAVQLKREDS